MSSRSIWKSRAALLFAWMLLAAPVLGQAEVEEELKPARAPDVPYVPTPQEVVDKMLEMGQVSEGDVVYDLGCGDGRIVITAAKRHGARGVGVDINPQRIVESNANAKAAGVTDRVEFRTEDLFEMKDLAKADVVTLYLLPSVNIKLRPKLLAELKPGTRVVSHAFDMDDWQPEQETTVDGRSVYLWIIPARVEGQWKVAAPAGGEAQPAAAQPQPTIKLTQTYQMLSGTLQLDGAEYAIREGRINGDKIQFSANRDNQTLRFTGQFKDNRIHGTLDHADQQRELTLEREDPKREDK